MARCLQEINLGSDVCWILARCWQQSGWIMVEILVPTFYQYWTNAVPICESMNGPIHSANIWPLFKPIFGQYWTHIYVLAGVKLHSDPLQTKKKKKATTPLTVISASEVPHRRVRNERTGSSWRWCKHEESMSESRVPETCQLLVIVRDL